MIKNTINMTTVYNHISHSAQCHNIKNVSCIFTCIKKAESLNQFLNYIMEAPVDSKHKTTNTERIQYINKQNCKKGLTVYKEVTMIRNWSNENQSLALETELEINQNYK